ncbi:sodium:proton antiporter [Halobacillus yeomjeoni]|uniref:cation:proton antiporter n=1 Tax=Halobacillus yeomjeoni TaxID=311194 RepID=UPI001CD63257|nr:sodium:proton antiporter [Halobacillus yeomjeoni]MCA0985273.1 sodium:proton antiporter [Halobacillus yeomjeoni]
MSVSQVILLLLVGYSVFTLDKKQKHLPVPTLLFLLGIILSFIPYFAGMDVTERVLYDIFLPALLFVSAYRFSPKALKKNAGIIGLLSTVGLIVTALLLGFFTHVVLGSMVSITLVGALLIASILTPTDPVSVVSILKQSANNEKVADVVDGESMINDGTSVVLFTVLLGIYTSDKSFSAVSFISEFLYVSLGGAVLGILFGWAVSKAVHITQHKEYQVMLSIILSYGIFHLAEHIGVSGVLATVASGVMLAWEFDHTNKEDHYREALDGFWGVVEPTILSIVFLLMGIELTNHFKLEHWGLMVLLFVASLIIRFIVISGVIQFFAFWKKSIGWKDTALITWSGIRGTMSVVLLLSLEAKVDGEAELLLSLCFGVIFLSLVVQSLGIYPLSQKMKD